MPGEECGAAGGRSPRQGFGKGACERFDRRAPAAERLRREPVAAESGLSGREKCIVAAARRRREPGLERLAPGRRDGGERADRIEREIARQRIAEELREQGIGLAVGDRGGAAHHEFDEPRRLEETRRTLLREGERAVELRVAGRDLTRTIGNDRRSVGGLNAARAPAEIAAQQPAVDVVERGRRGLEIAGGCKPLGLHCEQPGPQRWQIRPGPLARRAEGGRQRACARGHVGGEGQPKRLFERAGVAMIGRGVGGLLEILERRSGLVGVEGDPPQHDQAPRRERVIELVGRDQAAIQQRQGLVGLALRPLRHAERDVDPRLRPVVGRRGPAHERLGGIVERGAFPRQLAEDLRATVERDHEAAHDLLRPDRIVSRRGEHAALLEHLLRIGAPLADRERIGDRRGRRVALAAAPRGDALLREPAQRLLRKLHGQQPLSIGGPEQERLVVGGDRLAKPPELVVGLADHHCRGDRIDPTLGTGADAAAIFLRSDLEAAREITGGERGESGVVARGGHRAAPLHTAETGLEHHLGLSDPRHRDQDRSREQARHGRDEAPHAVVVPETALRLGKVPHVPPVASGLQACRRTELELCPHAGRPIWASWGGAAGRL